jgi:[ribosomal protein S5]-alanine N-acetyltransferase
MSDPCRDGEELVTRRLSLRRPAPADVHAIFSINSDQRACAHNPSDMLATRDEAQQLFRRWDEHWLRFGFGYWVVRRRDSATPIGFCGIKVMQLNESDVVNLFYRFDPAVWGSGLASEAAWAVTGWAAQNIPARALIARIRPQNVASQRVAIHAGLARTEHMDALGEMESIGSSSDQRITSLRRRSGGEAVAQVGESGAIPGENGPPERLPARWRLPRPPHAPIVAPSRDSGPELRKRHKCP